MKRYRKILASSVQSFRCYSAELIDCQFGGSELVELEALTVDRGISARSGESQLLSNDRCCCIAAGVAVGVQSLKIEPDLAFSAVLPRRRVTG